MSGAAVITGVTSFVGFHLANCFARAGWRVLATHSRERERYAAVQAARLDALDAGVALRQLDICNADALARLIGDEKPALWVHHAGYAVNYGSLDYDLAAAAAVNIAPLRPLYAALAGKGCGVIVTGSSMEYAGSDEANREDEACWPDTPYGLSKLGETLAARQLAIRHSVPTRVARLYIPFGPFDNPNKLLSSVAAAMAAGKPVDLSPCEQRRDFTAVADVCQGYLALARDMGRETFDVFNLCGGRAVALKALLLAMAQSAKRDPALLRFGAIPMRPGEPPVSFGDNSKAVRLLGWQPRPAERMVDALVAA
jgi:nucleoside-diphosphate-sugar epimerase